MRHWIFRYYWMMVAALILAALLLTVGPTLAQPPVPHGVIEGDDCLSCHEAGVANAPRLSRDHMGRRNEDCAICHEASGAFAGDIPHPVAGQEDCLSCHSEGIGTMLGRSHVDYTNDECSLCHFPSVVAAAESTATQGRPHIAIGGNACVSCHPLSFVEWSLDMDCGAVCHTMRPQVDSLQNVNLLAHAHAQAGLVCVDCHEPAVLEQVHEGATDPNITELKERMFPKEFCFDCHLPNEHTSYEEIIARTEDYTVGDQKINPHASSEKGEIECSSCHSMHKESPAGSSKDACLVCHGPFDELISATDNYTWPRGEKTSPHRYVPHDSKDIKDIPECSYCHEPHPVPLTSTEGLPEPDPQWCYGCHHEKVLECGTCHPVGGP